MWGMFDVNKNGVLDLEETKDLLKHYLKVMGVAQEEEFEEEDLELMAKHLWGLKFKQNEGIDKQDMVQLIKSCMVPNTNLQGGSKSKRQMSANRK